MIIANKSPQSSHIRLRLLEHIHKIMADSPAWPNTGEMVLCEIYLHQHSPTNGYFDLFHIYEFRNYLDQPQVPSFSTNCTEPDDLNKALLKMNHLENLDTSEIQRRLVDCVDQGEGR